MAKGEISERRVARRLARLLAKVLEREGGHVRSFEENGLMTSDQGVVINLGNGQEFQLTVVESTRYWNGKRCR